ncbi:hypothetical protein V5P15_11800 [Escherichia coli]|uniref:hypothetical protein n=1 Tax=Escherichia coli TaxID=562 RepID=UPI000BDE9A62|nr:hypothetical protein [Escherichia coli]ECD9464185.1 hypothetical protein [Salmonella enterica subsp. diarizonae]EGY9634033.1 hypothetical protein [Salmonella enterica subsp. enterica serovar Rough O:c:z]EIB9281066.1 hypothetical protein [Salmonella enterica]EEW2123559.1 hypothetical protein [Escherichia coli]EEW2156743.1 hypothetical protein [Escherichia coli]
MDESRKQFEEWFKNKYHVSSDVMKIMHIKVEIAWEAWQASRAAIEIECPGKREREAFSTDFEDGVTFGYNDAISECEGLIRAAGVKVKE